MIVVTLWLGRLAWALLPVTAADPLGAAMRDWDPAAAATVSVALWLSWALTLLAALVPHPAALTVWRVMAPAAVAAVVLAAAAGEPSLIAAIDALACVAVAYSPATSLVFVNGPAYGNERRYPLRPPGWVLLGPAMVAWAVLVGGPAAAVLLLANRLWVPGVIVAVAGTGAAAIAGRALHGLARRWLVFVPAGVVVHDPLTLADPVLFQKPVIASIGPAPRQTDDERVDLTAGALGLAVELRFVQPTDVFVITRPGRRPTAETVATTRLLVAPTRGAAVLAEAKDRGLRVN